MRNAGLDEAQARINIVGRNSNNSRYANDTTLIDPGLIPGLGRSPGEGNGKPLQYSCFENPMNSMKTVSNFVQIQPSHVT